MLFGGVGLLGEGGGGKYYKQDSFQIFISKQMYVRRGLLKALAVYTMTYLPSHCRETIIL